MIACGCHWHRQCALTEHNKILSCFKLLLEFGADITFKNKNNNHTIIFYIVDRIDFLKAIVDYDLDIDLKEIESITTTELNNYYWYAAQSKDVYLKRYIFLIIDLIRDRHRLTYIKTIEAINNGFGNVIRFKINSYGAEITKLHYMIINHLEIECSDKLIDYLGARDKDDLIDKICLYMKN